MVTCGFLTSSATLMVSSKPMKAKNVSTEPSMTRYSRLESAFSGGISRRSTLPQYDMPAAMTISRPDASMIVQTTLAHIDS